MTVKRIAYEEKHTDTTDIHSFNQNSFAQQVTRVQHSAK